MSIEERKIVDILSLDSNRDVVLTVSDHLEWTDTDEHQCLLQDKLNDYLAFVETGDLLQQYPKAARKQVLFRVVLKYKPDQAGRIFLERARDILEKAGFRFKYEVSPSHMTTSL